jgi:hypothetical protein
MPEFFFFSWMFTMRRENYLSLAGSGAGDDLQISVDGCDGALLRWCVVQLFT